MIWKGDGAYGTKSLEREAVNERLPGITNNVGIRHVYYCAVGLYQ
ncbi:hypothetical protein SDC49_25415 [Lactobacillus sp. R2/2]|nr:hypothetical protein [Lactobacillus sp. R2/2]